MQTCLASLPKSMRTQAAPWTGTSLPISCFCSAPPPLPGHHGAFFHHVTSAGPRFSTGTSNQGRRHMRSPWPAFAWWMQTCQHTPLMGMTAPCGTCCKSSHIHNSPLHSLWHAGSLQHMATIKHPCGAWPVACAFMRDAKTLVTAHDDRSVCAACDRTCCIATTDSAARCVAEWGGRNGRGTHGAGAGGAHCPDGGSVGAGTACPAARG